MSCKTCRFYSPGGYTTHEGWPLGDCRRRAPGIAGEADYAGEKFKAKFPQVFASGWCGEWEADMEALEEMFRAKYESPFAEPG